MAAWWKLQTNAGGKKDDKVQLKHQGWAIILVSIHSQEYRLPVPEVVNFQGRAETSTLEGRWREQGGRRLLSKEITNIKGIFGVNWFFSEVLEKSNVEFPFLKIGNWVFDPVPKKGKLFEFGYRFLNRPSHSRSHCRDPKIHSRSPLLLNTDG